MGVGGRTGRGSGWRGRTIGNVSRWKYQPSLSLLVYWMLIRTGARIRMRRAEVARFEGVERGVIGSLPLAEAQLPIADCCVKRWALESEL